MCQEDTTDEVAVPTCRSSRTIPIGDADPSSAVSSFGVSVIAEVAIVGGHGAQRWSGGGRFSEFSVFLVSHFWESVTQFGQKKAIL